MRIGIVVPSISRLAGGLYHSVRLLCRHLDVQEGLDITVSSLKDTYTEKDILAWQPLQPRVLSITGPKSFGYSRGLVGAMLDADADLVHLQGGPWRYTALASAVWARKTNRPYMISLRGMLDPWALRNAYWKKIIAQRLFSDKLLHGATCLHSLCEAETSALRGYGLCNAICQIPNGVELPEWDNERIDAPWQGRIEHGAKVLLYLGRIHPKKGLINLLGAFRLSRERTVPNAKEWTLVIAGWDQGGHEHALKALVRRQGLEDVVQFIGPIYGKDKAAAFSHANAFVLPSFSEGLPMAVLESWAYRLPVVMTQACNLPEGARTGAALEVHPDMESIAEGIADLFVMGDKERRAMGMKGRTLVEVHFTWARVASQLREVYEWGLGGGNPPNTVLWR